MAAAAFEAQYSARWTATATALAEVTLTMAWNRLGSRSRFRRWRAKAWLRKNIAVYDVQPGLIATDMTAPVIESYRKRAADGLTLLPRVGEPEEMGRIIAALAAGKLPYTTGQAISADGGLLVSRF
jgi:NAD(P)-dependent dehydrogenase (short-subunit alcohol dehydrogenase family)